MEQEEKKKKKRSLSSQIRSLREDRDEWRAAAQKRYSFWRKAENILEEIGKVFPKKYYKIEFKIKAKDETMVNRYEIVESYTPNMAIKLIKDDKIYPNSFELLDIKVLT